MSAELDEVKREVAAAHGLGADAISFIGGTTVEQIEANAAAFARLVHAGGANQQPEPAGRNIFAEATAQKAARKAELRRLFTGRPTRQPRDEDGRFSGMDGGARTRVPTPRSPEREHGELVAGLAALARTFGRPFSAG